MFPIMPQQPRLRPFRLKRKAKGEKKRKRLKKIRHAGDRVMRYWFRITIVGLCGAALVQLKYTYDTNKNPNYALKQGESYGEADVGRGNWEMMDTDGNRVSNTDYLGRYTLMYFGFTFCPDVCPRELRKVANTIDILKERGVLDKVVPIFVSVDPRRDSPKVIRRYLDQFHKEFVGLTGTNEQLENFARVMRTYFTQPPKLETDYILEHSTYTYFCDTEGNFVDIGKSEDDPVYLANKICEWIAKDAGEWAVMKTKTRNYLRSLRNRNSVDGIDKSMIE